MNYGGFFIFWDKLFGTFAPYAHEPDYGVTAGIRSWSPFWANLHPYAELARRARRAPDWRAAVEVWIRPPEWQPPWDTRDAPTLGYGQPVPRATAIYSLFQLGIALGASLALLWPGVVNTGVIRYALTLFVLSTLVTVAAYWDHRPWARRAEALRLGVLMGGGIALVWFGATTADTLAAVVAVCALSGGALPGSPTARTAEPPPHIRPAPLPLSSEIEL
jgi:hypothetical protein